MRDLTFVAVLAVGASACGQKTSPATEGQNVVEDSYSVVASARARGELGVSTWVSKVSDARIAVLGYSARDEVVVAWSVLPISADESEQSVAQTRFALQMGTMEAAISISSEARPRIFENSFAERPDIVQVMEVMRDDLRASSLESSGKASTLTALDNDSLVEASCSSLIHERCGEVDRLTAETSLAIAPACGGQGVTAKKIWSVVLDQVGIGTECSDAHERFLDASRQSRDCRTPIASSAACNCERPKADSPKCH